MEFSIGNLDFIVIHSIYDYIINGHVDPSG